MADQRRFIQLCPNCGDWDKNRKVGMCVGCAKASYEEVEVVPAEVAERLAEALERLDENGWDDFESYEHARKVLAEFRSLLIVRSKSDGRSSCTDAGAGPDG